MIEARLKITGTVQGVFYRANCKEQADQLGIKGWVKNEPDGSVSVLAQGEKDQINTFLDWCRQGPPTASVENVEVNLNPQPDKILEEFEII